MTMPARAFFLSITNCRAQRIIHTVKATDDTAIERLTVATCSRIRTGTVTSMALDNFSLAAVKLQVR